jgi:hypothetical protein
VIRFRFELYPLDEVSSWGGDQPTLHWFGLTEGWYWLEIGGHQLLRRTRLDHPYPYVDYLARLWEDVDVQWACDPLAFVTACDEDGSADIDPNAPDHPVVTAAKWYGEHSLDLGYLRNAPSLRFWRTVRD